MLRTSGDKGGDAGPFSVPSCPVHRGNFGGGKPTLPMVPPMQHSGPLAYVERKAPCHLTVFQRGGAEDKTVSGGGIAGEHGEVLLGLWRTFGKCDGVYLSGTCDDRG